MRLYFIRFKELIINHFYIWPLITLGYVSLFHYQVPLWDHQDLIPFLRKYYTSNLTFQDFFASHGGHFHGSAYIVMFLLAICSNWSSFLEPLASLLFMITSFWIWYRFLKKNYESNFIKKALFLSAFFFFSLDQASNWLWGWQVAVFINISTVIVAITLLCVTNIRLLGLILAIICVDLAIFGFSTAIPFLGIGFILIALSPSANKLRNLIIWTLNVIIVGIIFYINIAKNHKVFDYLSLDYGLFLIKFNINFIAGSIVRFAKDLTIPIVILGLYLLTISYQHIKLKISLNNNYLQKTLPFLALMLFGLGSSLITGIGRGPELGAEQGLVGRYISFSNFFWLGLILLVYYLKPSNRYLSLIVILLIGLKTGNIIQYSVKNAGIATKYNTAAKEFRATYPQIPQQLMFAYHDQEVLRHNLEFLNHYNLSIFRNKADEKQ